MQLRFCLCGTALIGDFATVQLLLSLEQENNDILQSAMQIGKLSIPSPDLPRADRRSGEVDIIGFLAD